MVVSDQPEQIKKYIKNQNQQPKNVFYIFQPVAILLLRVFFCTFALCLRQKHLKANYRQMKKNYSRIIGIDPDVEKSGVALIDKREPQKTRLVTALSLPALYDWLNTLDVNGETVVVVEDSWTNGGQWHLPPRCKPQIAAKIGENTGRCHQVGRIIVEMCQHIGIPCDPVQPLVKMWAGKDRKITHAEIAEITGLKKSRTNQEERDALLIAWVYSGLPLRLKVNKR